MALSLLFLRTVLLWKLIKWINSLILFMQLETVFVLFATAIN